MNTTKFKQLVEGLLKEDTPVAPAPVKTGDVKNPVDTKSELQKYFTNYFKTIRWSKKRRDKWLECKHDFLYVLAFMFSKQNKSFVMALIECVTSNVCLK